MLVIKIKFIILFLISISTYSIADTKQIKDINILFDSKKKIENIYDARLVERKILSIWHKHPSNKDLTDKLKLGIEIMSYGDYSFALKIFNNIIKQDPLWAEVWNKRATLLYITNEYNRSLKDIDIVLEIEPRHFGALSGRVQIFFKQKRYLEALEDLEKIKKIFPSMIDNEFINELNKLANGLNI